MLWSTAHIILGTETFEQCDAKFKLEYWHQLLKILPSLHRRTQSGGITERLEKRLKIVISNILDKQKIDRTIVKNDAVFDIRGWFNKVNFTARQYSKIKLSQVMYGIFIIVL